MWLDWLVFCDYGFSVSAFWCLLATSTVLLGFLLPWKWVISSRLLQQSAATAPYLGRGLSKNAVSKMLSLNEENQFFVPIHIGNLPSTWELYLQFNTWLVDLNVLSLLAIPAWCNVDCSQLMSQFDHYQLQLVYSMEEHHQARNLAQKFAHHFWCAPSVTAPSPHTTQIFFSVLHFHLSLNIKYNMPKMLSFFHLQY